MKSISFFAASIIFSFCLVTSSLCQSDSEYYNRLYYTGKVWGFLKYFHSDVAKGNKDWDEVLIKTVQKIKNNVNNEDFNNSITDMINSAGTLAIPTNPFMDVPDSLKFNLDLNWLHYPGFSDEVKERLDSVKSMFRQQDNFYLGAEEFVSNPKFVTDTNYYNASQYPNEDIRFLALFRYWNIINYFFPYKNIMDKNWDSTLVEFIPKVLGVTDALSYNLVFLQLNKRINDTHGFTVSNTISNFWGTYYLPLNLSFIENETVITQVYNSQVEIGDIVKSINDIDIKILRDSLEKYTQGSNIAAVNRFINNHLLTGPQGSVRLKVENDKREKTVTLYRGSAFGGNKIVGTMEEAWKIINAGSQKIGYVDMALLMDEDIDLMFADLWLTDGIIFDLRNYPNGTLWGMVRYLFDAPIHIANFSAPDIRFPGTFFWEYETIGEGDFSKTYRNNIFILFNEITLSQAEYTVMGLSQHPKAIKIGSQTSGADGNVSFAYLPGGIKMYFTGLGTFYPDFTPTQRIGIVPDIEVHPTIAGIRKGVDEVLDAALKFTTRIIDLPQKPGEYSLSQNYPNPFNPTTKIRWHMPEGDNVSLTIYDILGREISRIVNEYKAAGSYEAEFSPNNLASGIYFYKLQAGRFSKTMKMMLAK